MIRRIVLLAVLALGVPGVALAADDEEGTLEGRLVNGSEGGSSVAGVEVTLEAYVDGEEVVVGTAVTDEDGRFVFEGLSTVHGDLYRIRVTYHETDYYGEVVSFEEGETVVTSQAIVYDGTTSDADIVVTNSHTIVALDEGGLRITEFNSFANQGDRSYLGDVDVGEGKKATLRFDLPEGAVDLRPEEGLMECCVYASEDGFVDSMPFPPGTKEVIYSYFVPNTSSNYRFLRAVYYPTGRYQFMVQGGGVSVESDRLVPGEPLDMEGVSYSYASGTELDRGEAVVALVSGLPVNSNRMAFIWIGATLGVLAAGFGLCRLRRKAPEQGVVVEEDPEELRQRLLVELARMDDAFESGDIPEAAYRERRAEVKSHLVKLTQRARTG